MSDEPFNDRRDSASPSDSECTEAEAFLTAVLDSLHEHVAVLDREGRIIAVNRAWIRFAGDNGARSASAISEGVDYLKVCGEVSGEDSEYAEQALEGIKNVLNGGGEMFRMEYPCSSPAEERWFLMTVVPLRRPEGGAVVTHADITRRKIAEDLLKESEDFLERSREEYRALARKLLAAGEDAKRRLARELHDSLSQRLAVVSMLAAKMNMESPEDATFREKVKRIQDEMSRLSGEINDLARQLHPRILEDLGLRDAMESLCSSFSKSEGIPVEINCREIPVDIPREKALNLYRIAQETLRNISRHAKASRVRVDMEYARGMLRLSISDDGKGFDAKAALRKKRLGLVSLRERAELIGASTIISSSLGSGTKISVEVPLHDI